MFGLNDRDRGIAITPFFHGNGMSNVRLALGVGASCIFPRTFSARRFWGLVDRYRPTYMITLAAVMNIVMSLPPSTLDRSHSFRVLVVLGSGPNMAAIEERYGTPVIDWYGMTEAGMGTYTRLGEPRPPGSAGRPFPGTDMRIFRDDGTEAEIGEIGEVVFNTDVTGFRGYLNDEEATRSVLTGKWFHTGDMGYFDKDGYFFFADRKKDIVRRGGENISSLEVESVIQTHPAVAAVAIVAKPDPVLGERLVAFIQPQEGQPAPTVEELYAFLRRETRPFQDPRGRLRGRDAPSNGHGQGREVPPPGADDERHLTARSSARPPTWQAIAEAVPLGASWSRAGSTARRRGSVPVGCETPIQSMTRCLLFLRHWRVGCTKGSPNV